MLGFTVIEVAVIVALGVLASEFIAPALPL